MSIATRTLTETEYQQHTDALSAGRLQIGTAPTPAQFLALARMLEAAGYGRSSELNHLRELHKAALTAVGYPPTRLLDEMIVALTTPEDVARLIRDTALNYTLAHSQHNVFGGAIQAFESNVLPYAETAFTAMADPAVTAMRPEFTAAVEAIQAAHSAGLTPETTAAGIAVDGTPAQLKAFRALGPAAATLDRLADLRIRVHHLLDWQRYDSDERALACFLAGPVDDDTLESAANRYRGHLETVLVRSAIPSNGPAVKQAARPRLGGPWLDLVSHGHTLSLHTPSEVTANLAEARG